MLPSNLLRARVSRGKIRPLYVSLEPDTIALAERIRSIFGEGIGKRKGELLDRLREVEDEGHDFKLVRGLAALLERRCVFEPESAVDPREARIAVFEEASRRRATTPEERSGVLRIISGKLGLSQESLERTLYSDIEEELILRNFKPLDPDPLLKRYNLSLTQTLLFKALRVEFSASGNWKRIFRQVKRLGLIYSVERDGDRRGTAGAAGEGYTVSLDGPLSLFRMTERYGVSIAKLLPEITASEPWRISAEILARSRGGRVYAFEADSREVGSILNAGGFERYYDDNDAAGGGEGARATLYDSAVEERFARSFLSYDSGWTLRREPEPLLADRHVLIPDFSFERDGLKVYLEVVGFWTSEYLDRKIRKLNSIPDVDMIIAADESLACSKLERLKGKAAVLYYKREVPLKPIIEHLKKREASLLREQAEALRMETIALQGETVSFEEFARERGVSVEAVRLALQDFEAAGYARVGDLFISRKKLEEIDRKLAGVERLTDALGIIEASGVKAEDGQRVLDALGYTSVWEGMEMEKVRISKTADVTTKKKMTSSGETT